MKKLLSVLIVAVLLVSCAVTAVFAEAAATITVGKDDVKAGETATINVEISELTFQDFWVTVKVSEPLKLTAVNEGSASHGSFGANLTTGKVATYDDTEETKSGILFTAEFKVADDAAPGKYPVEVVVESFYNDNDQKLEVASIAGYVEVVCDHNWGEWKVNMEPTCTEPGEKVRICAICGAAQPEVLPALGHKYSVKNDDKNHWQECSVCRDMKDIAPHTGLDTWQKDDTHHWHECSFEGCTYEADKAEHKYEIKNTDNNTWDCICGKHGHAIGEKDDEPANGDITGQLHLMATALLLVVMTPAVILIKRKSVK